MRSLQKSRTRFIPRHRGVGGLMSVVLAPRAVTGSFLRWGRQAYRGEHPGLVGEVADQHPHREG
jgi:hypothetical protein